MTDRRVPSVALASDGRPPDADLSSLPGRTQMVDDLRQRPQPHSGSDSAALLGK